MTETIDAWTREFGDINPFEKSASPTFSLEMNVAYFCEIKDASVVQSQKGDVQLKLSLVVLKGTGEESEEAGRFIEYITLPKQSSDLQLNNFELVSKLTQRRTADVVRILSAADRPTYALYDRAGSEKGQTVYFGFDGNPMTKEDFATREAEIQEKIIAFVDDLHGKIGSTVDLDGTRLFIKKVPNKKSPKYPYTNLYAQRPRDTEIFGEEAAPF